MAERFNRERAHSLTVSSARLAAARHSFSSRGRARMLKFTEREEATRDLLLGRKAVVNTSPDVVAISRDSLAAPRSDQHATARDRCRDRFHREQTARRPIDRGRRASRGPARSKASTDWR